MKLSKSITCLVSSIALLGTLAACNNKESSSTSTSPEQTDSTPDNTGKYPKPSSVNITFWHTFGDTIEKQLNNEIDEFADLVKEHDGVDITIQADYKGNYDELQGIIIKGFATGAYPNISVAYPDNVANYLDEAKANVVNLEELMNDETIGFGTMEWLGDYDDLNVFDSDDFIQAFLDESYSYSEEGAYSLPFMKSSEIMFYNKNAFYPACQLYAPEGVDTSSEQAMDEWISNISWDELMDFATFISENRNNGNILSTLEYPVYYDSDSNLLITKLIQNDIGYSDIDENGVGKILFQTGEAREKAEAMVKELVRLHGDGNLETVGDDIFTTKALEGTYGSNAFVEQKTIFSIGSSGGTGYNDPQSDSFEVGVCKVPYDNDNPVYVNQGPTLTMFHNTRDEATDYWRTYYSWLFIKYITNPEANARMCIRSNGYVPVRYSGYETATYQTFLGDENNILVKASNILQDDIQGNYIVTPVFIGSAQLRDEMGTILNSSCPNEANFTVTQSFDRAINNALNYFN